MWLLVIPKAQRLSLWDNWGDERGCDEGHWHAHTRGLQWGLPEDVGKVKQVQCSRRRLLRRGLEFHVYTINKSAHTKKKLGNLSYAPRVYIYIYIYIYIHTRKLYLNLYIDVNGWRVLSQTQTQPVEFYLCSPVSSIKSYQNNSTLCLIE